MKSYFSTRLSLHIRSVTLELAFPCSLAVVWRTSEAEAYTFPKPVLDGSCQVGETLVLAHFMALA
jgi:hypothetical protein